MFGEIFGFLRDTIQFLWPFVIVREWERGAVYEFGKFVREVGPGCWPIIPWFTEVREISIAEAIVGTGRQDITLMDGSLLSFSATAKVRVIDIDKAINTVDEYRETAQELLSSVLADKIATYRADQLSPESRGRLTPHLVRWVQEEAEVYGLKFERVRFTSFVLNLRTYRLLMEQNSYAKW